MLKLPPAKHLARNDTSVSTVLSLAKKKKKTRLTKILVLNQSLQRQTLFSMSKSLRKNGFN
jgi:hypothetical protein